MRQERGSCGTRALGAVEMSAETAPRGRLRDPTEPEEPIPDEVTPESVLATVGAETKLVRSLLDEEDDEGKRPPFAEVADAIRERFEDRPAATVGITAAAVCVAGVSVKLLLSLLRRIRRRGNKSTRKSGKASADVGCAHDAWHFVQCRLAASAR